jgi:D-glycero-D-manno-heptose 1,7-bisphosphate phosphatase
VEKHGGKIDDIFFAPDRPDQATERRKPGAGMLLEALKKYNADASKTPFIGDAITDMQAAYTADCPRYLVMTGKGHASAENMPLSLYPVQICSDILDAAKKIVEKQ